MERKIGETFEYQGKTYKVAEFDDCRNCAFIHINCSSLRSITGNCMDFLRNDGANVYKFNNVDVNAEDGIDHNRGGYFFYIFSHKTYEHVEAVIRFKRVK